MGATGGIMMGTLLDELERRKGTTGIVAASGKQQEVVPLF